MESGEFITRAQLYEMVWREPMSRIASRFGISDVTLRRICERHDIPRPSPGYWSKLAYGKPVERISLEVDKRALTEKVRVRPSAGLRIWIASALASAWSVFVVSADS